MAITMNQINEARRAARAKMEATLPASVVSGLIQAVYVGRTRTEQLEAFEALAAGMPLADVMFRMGR